MGSIFVKPMVSDRTTNIIEPLEEVVTKAGIDYSNQEMQDIQTAVLITLKRYSTFLVYSHVVVWLNGQQSGSMILTQEKHT